MILKNYFDIEIPVRHYTQWNIYSYFPESQHIAVRMGKGSCVKTPKPWNKKKKVTNCPDPFELPLLFFTHFNPAQIN